MRIVNFSLLLILMLGATQAAVLGSLKRAPAQQHAAAKDLQALLDTDLMGDGKIVNAAILVGDQVRARSHGFELTYYEAHDLSGTIGRLSENNQNMPPLGFMAAGIFYKLSFYSFYEGQFKFFMGSRYSDKTGILVVGVFDTDYVIIVTYRQENEGRAVVKAGNLSCKLQQHN